MKTRYIRKTISGKKAENLFKRFKGKIAAGTLGLTVMGAVFYPGCNYKPVKEITGREGNLSVEKQRLDNRLMEAVTGGDVYEVRKLVRKGVDVNAKDGKETALGRACDCGYHQIAVVLLENGADVNAGSEFGATPLMLASIHGENAKILELLIDNGADINAKDDFGRTALIYAAGFGDAKMVRLLLDRGADPDIMGEGLLIEDKQTALDMAVYLERAENIEILKENR